MLTEVSKYYLTVTISRNSRVGINMKTGQRRKDKEERTKKHLKEIKTGISQG